MSRHFRDLDTSLLTEADSKRLSELGLSLLEDRPFGHEDICDSIFLLRKVKGYTGNPKRDLQEAFEQIYMS